MSLELPPLVRSGFFSFFFSSSFLHASFSAEHTALLFKLIGQGKDD